MHISITELSAVLEASVPEIDFALLFGSARHGTVEPLSDVDIGVYLNVTATPDLVLTIMKTVENVTSCTCDLTILNTASEILGFEALQGQLLFVREDKLDDYAQFYSLTCRLYEDTIVWMQKQLALRGYDSTRT
ncbi:MAG: nucleotidyltransferase domain-containing protein [Pseudomonadota bacterium]